MDRLLQGTDEETGQPFALFGKVKIQTLPGGRFRVEDELHGRTLEFNDRDEALRAAGVAEEQIGKVQIAPEAAIVSVRGLVSEIELRTLDRIAKRQGLTREAAVRRAIAEFLLRHLDDEAP
jgi:hypothetical protein